MHPVHRLHEAPGTASSARPAHVPGDVVAPSVDTSQPARAEAPRPRREVDAGAPATTRPLLPRRERPWLLVVVDPDPASHAALVWALREAARREATVVAVSIESETAGAGEAMTGWPSAAAHDSRLTDLRTRVREATTEAGVRPPVRTAVLDAQVFEALAGAARGADLVVVGAHGKTVLRPAVARTPARRA